MKNINSKDTALEAAQKTLQAHNQAIVDRAVEDYKKSMEDWCNRNPECTLMIAGELFGNQNNLGIKIILKQK